MKHRRVIRENIATPGHPVWRARVATPLTPHAVRLQLLATPPGLPEAGAAAWRERRIGELGRMLTPLDRMLTGDEALALERYAAAEAMLEGTARTAGYLSDSVQTSAKQTTPLRDRDLDRLREHQRAKRRLGMASIAVLAVFARQMAGTEGAPSDAQAGWVVAPLARNKRLAWHEAVRAAAAELIAASY